jgi:Transposase DNA-binding/Transposase Tn5 dimerisation domain
MCESKTSSERSRLRVIAPWVAQELAGVELGDKRLRRRAQIIMTQFSQQPTASIPQACGQWSDIKATYRFFDNDAVRPEQLLLAHSQATVRRAQPHSIVLAVQDTTSLNYSTHPRTEGLGPIGNNADKTVGLFVHSTLALTLSGEPLGLLDVQVRSRERQHFGRSRNAHQRNRRAVAEKESQRWLDSLRVCQQVAQACPQTTLVNVTDREGDVYELFEQALHEQNTTRVHLLVRAQHNRQVQQGAEQKLWPHLAAQAAAATLSVRVPRQTGQAGRRASLTIRFGSVTLCAPTLKEQKPSLHLWAVQAQEEHPPDGQKAILWRLLTTLPVASAAQAVEKVQWYCQRWQIEVLHKILKSGCKIEHRQLETAMRLRRVLMMDLIVAWRILLLSKVARQTPEASAADWLLEREWKVLWCYMKEQPAKDPPTLLQAVRWIGQLGGFIGRKSDGEPGPIVLWRGLLRLHDLVHTWNILNNMGNA